jgi:hypothetical protein
VDTLEETGRCLHAVKAAEKDGWEDAEDAADTERSNPKRGGIANSFQVWIWIEA